MQKDVLVNKKMVSNQMRYKKTSFFPSLMVDINKRPAVYMMIVPVVLYYIVFCYVPMYGAVIAFQNFNPAQGILKSQWVGLENFLDFFQSRYFVRVLTNTLGISVKTLIFGFPAPIILALLINELKSKSFTKITQTITYLPHFISLVVVCGMIKDFVAQDGVITMLLTSFNIPQQDLLNNKEFFVPIYVISGIWQEVGWGSIIYLAALTGIDPQLYEAATIDGANRWKQMLNVTLPGILPTIVVMLILRMGSLLSVGYEKIILLYNPATYETADVISSFTYRRGLLESDWSFSSAVGLFNSVINFILIITANSLSRRLNNTNIW